MALDPGDAAHNYQPYYTGLGGNNFMWANTGNAINPKAGYNGQASTKYPTSLGLFCAVNWNSPTKSGNIMGMDYTYGNSAEPNLSYSNATGSTFLNYYDAGRTDAALGLGGNAGQNNIVHYVGLDINNQQNDPIGANPYTIGINGRQVAGISDIAPYLAGGNISVGANGKYGNDYSGDIMEAILYTGSVSPDEAQRINSYLAIKYGVSLHQDPPLDYIASDGSTHYWTYPTHSGYTSNLFGIGRDDNTGLYQKQSNSVSDQGIAISIDIKVAANNQANTGVFAADIQYVMLGDNGQTPGTTSPYVQPIGTSFLNGVTTAAMSNISGQVWKAQVTNFQGPAVISIAPSSRLYPTVKYVLVSAQSNFPPSSTSIFPVLNGTAANVSLPDGAYIALGMLSTAPGGVSAGLAFWARADEGTSASGWIEQSQNHFSLSPVGSNIKLSSGDAGHNFQPYYTGFGGNNYLWCNTGTKINPYAASNGQEATQFYTPLAMFSAVNWADKKANGNCMGMDNIFGNSAEPGFSYSNAEGKAFVNYQYTNRQDNATNISGQPGQDNIFSYSTTNGGYQGIHPPSVVNNYAIGINGNQAIGSTTMNSFLSGGNISVGANGKYGYDYSGAIMESILYTSTLSANQVQQINSYLAIKYGVTLGSPTNPIAYLNSAGHIIWPSSSTYQNNIAGIGRDDLSGLNQKQSTSANSALPQLTFALTGFSATNAMNSGIFSSDMSSLVWGDNNVQGSLADATIPVIFSGTANAGSELKRIWRVQADNLTQEVLVFVPNTMLGKKSTGCEGIALITGTSDVDLPTPGLDQVVAMQPTVVNGVPGFSCAVTFPAGISYFTIGLLTSLAPGEVSVDPTSTSSIGYSTCNTAGWYYFYSDAGHSKKLFAIDPNGNTNWNPANFQAVVNVTKAGVPYAGADSKKDSSRIMGRTLTITDASAQKYLINGGVKVRFYFNSKERQLADFSNGIGVWFKYSGSLDQLLKVQNSGAGFTGPFAFWPNPSNGTENGASYTQFDNVTSFSTFGFLSANNGAPLPLPFFSFKAKLQECSINLAWTAGDEESVKAYHLEYSTDGISFIELDSLLPRGDNSRYQYAFKPGAANQDYYFRLVAAYGNAKTFTSQIVVVRYPDCTLSSGSGALRVFPNPAGSNIVVELPSAGMHTLLLYTTTGILVKSVSTPAAVWNIDISKLATGAYFIKAIDSKGNFTTASFIKTK